jgi:hypothetical protein
VLGDDHQRAGRRVHELEVAAIRSAKRERPLESLAEQQAGPGQPAQFLGRRVKPPGRPRLIQVEPGPRSELLSPKGQVLRAHLAQPGGRAAVHGLGSLQQLSEAPVPARLGNPWEWLRPLGSSPAASTPRF